MIIFVIKKCTTKLCINGSVTMRRKDNGHHDVAAWTTEAWLTDPERLSIRMWVINSLPASS